MAKKKIGLPPLDYLRVFEAAGRLGGFSAAAREFGLTQAAVSQQLARLRLEGLVSHRREGKAIYYSLSDDRARRMIALVYDMFCKSA